MYPKMFYTETVPNSNCLCKGGILGSTRSYKETPTEKGTHLITTLICGVLGLVGFRDSYFEELLTCPVFQGISRLTFGNVEIINAPKNSLPHDYLPEGSKKYHRYGS